MVRPFLYTLGFLLCWGGSPAAAENDLLVTPLTAFDGWVRRGGWTAVGAELETRGKAWSGRLAVTQDGSRSSLEAQVPRDSKKVFWLPVQAGGRSGPDRFIDLETRRGEDISAKFQLRELGPYDALVASLSDEGTLLGQLARATSPNGPGTLNLVPVKTAELPPHAMAYEALSALVASRWRPASMTPEQVKALQGWVASGGYLLLSAERDLSSLRAPWLQTLLPAKIAGDASLPVKAALERHTGAPTDPRDPEPWSARLEPLAGSKVLLETRQGALAVERPYGRGAVCLLAFDASDPTLAAYDGWAVFALELLGIHAPKSALTQASQRGAGPRSPMASRLEELFRRSTSPRENPSRNFALFCLVYLLALVPGNYLYMGYKGRREQVWLGMLAVIFVFTGLAWGLGSLGRAGETERGFYLIESGPGLASGRLSGWVSLFSPARRQRSLTVSQEVEAAADITSGSPRLVEKDARYGWTLERGASAGRIRLPMEVGEVRYLELYGQAALGEGLHTSWAPQGRPRGLRVDNRTGLTFGTMALMTSPTSVDPESVRRSVGPGATFLPFDPGRAAPLLGAAGPKLSEEYCALATAAMEPSFGEAPNRVQLVGLLADSAVPTMYLWSVPNDAEGDGAWWKRRLAVDAQPYRGNWHAYNDDLTLNAGQVTLLVPAPRLQDRPSGAKVYLNIEGNWSTKPDVQVFDFEKGRWAGEAAAEAAPSAAGIKLPDGPQAALAVHPDGLVRAAVVGATGDLRLVSIAGTSVRSTLIATGVDKRAAPAVAIDAVHRAQLVYRKAGRLFYAIDGGAKLARGEVPQSFGAGPPALWHMGGVLHLAFAVPGKGVRYASWASGPSWLVETVEAGADVGPAVGLWAGDAGGAYVLYRSGQNLRVASRLAPSSWRTDTIGGAALPAASLGLRLTYGNGALQAFAWNPGGPRPNELERHMNGGSAPHGGMASHWGRYSSTLPTPVAAVSASQGGGRDFWAAALDGSGAVRVINRYNVPVPIRDLARASSPFAFATDNSGDGILLYRGPSGLRLLQRRLPDETSASRGVTGSGGRVRGVWEFPHAPGLVWAQAGLARVRINASAPATIGRIELKDAP